MQHLHTVLDQAGAVDYDGAAVAQEGENKTLTNDY